MKTILILVFSTVTFLIPVQNLGQSPPQEVGHIFQKTPAQLEAVTELDATRRAYRDGNFAEAQRHAEKALALDPSNRAAPSFLARTIHAQYQPGKLDEANLAKAREAIEAYKQVLARNPESDEAYSAIAYLYNALKEDGLFREWVQRRALDSTASDKKRAGAFIALAGKDWDCSFKVTELPTSKMTTINTRGLIIQYLKPTDVAEFEKAQKCSRRGLEMIEMAITLQPDSETAWSYKVNLLSELAKLAEMEKDLRLKSDYEKQRDAARTTAETVRLSQSGDGSLKP